MTDAPRHAIDMETLVASFERDRVRGRDADGSTGAGALTYDSRCVRPGSVFVALRGERTDGHAFVPQAIRAGARAVVVDAAYATDSSDTPAGVATIVVPDTRRALSQLAAAACGHPSRAMHVVGVTGTNGKTTTTHLIAAVLGAAGIAAGRIGTLGARFGGAHWALDNTTPLALELQSLLGDMRDRGAQAVALEVSSHALALGRVADVDFALGVLTNVTRDHLDFHATFEQYAAAKRTLFDAARHAILNLDDACGRRWAVELQRGVRAPLTYGFALHADVRAVDVEPRAGGSAFAVGGARFELPLPGRFNVQNALAALCVARSLDVADAVTARAFANFTPVPGRMEHIAGGGVDVLVDYAHTPDALDAVLRAARESTRGRLTVVFGCGGDRDRGKRAEMGRVAAALADSVVVTSDNPRSEEPRAIVDAIVAGIGDARHVVTMLDRRLAIRHAVVAASPGDVVVVAGKGHETYQLIGTTTLHFDDREEVRAALAERPAKEAR